VLFRSKETDARAAEAGITDAFGWVLTFDGLFDRTGFVEDLREMMGILQEAYGCPVDVEFTANFFNGTYKINLVQCRPLQVRGGGAIMDAPRDLPADRKVIEAHGAVIGQAEIDRLDRIVYVVPDQYAKLPIRDRYSVARVIGEVCHASAGPRAPAILLAGPGRWGTTTPSLGVPVRFSDINTVSAICEIVAMSKDVVPDVSLGTHFFSEMIEMDILYFALFPGRPGALCNDEMLRGAANHLADIAPGSAQWAHVVRVIDASDLPAGRQFVINANPLKQHVICYLDERPAEAKEEAPS
jgi:pyruvate,water dikinase